MEKVKESSGLTFVVLNDFFDSFNRTVYSTYIDQEELYTEVILPFRTELSQLIPNLISYELEYIREQTQKKTDSRSFVVTMDDGSYFNKYDYNFNISRTAFRLGNIKAGPYFRLPRNNDRDIISQGQHLYEAYIKNGNQKQVILCDDGVGTGKSIEKTLNILNQLKVDVSKIFVLLNPNNLKSVNNFDIETILPLSGDFAWLSERDLFWGIPRSGVTCVLSHEGSSLVTSVPYTIDIEMSMSRIANFGEKNFDFRRLCLDYNKKLWSYIENKTGNPIYISQIPRLRGIGIVMNIGHIKIVDYLSSISNDDFKFDDGNSRNL